MPYIPILYQEEGNNMRTKMPLLLSILSIPVSLVIKAIAFYNGLLFDGMFLAVVITLNAIAIVLSNGSK